MLHLFVTDIKNCSQLLEMILFASQYSFLQRETIRDDVACVGKWTTTNIWRTTSVGRGVAADKQYCIVLYNVVTRLTFVSKNCSFFYLDVPLLNLWFG